MKESRKKEGMHRLILLIVASFLAISFSAFGAWKVFEGRDVILYCSKDLPDDFCRMVLQEQEDALKFVEKFLNIKVSTKEKILTYLILGEALRDTFTSWNSITYVVTPETVQKHEKLGAYEMSHVVVNRLWSGISPVMLKEGIAMAVDTTYRKNESRLHLLVNGLINLDEDKPALQLKPYEPFARQIMGSFTLYLIHKYGVEKIKELLEVQKKNRSGKLAETIKAVYGKDIEEIEKEWKDFLAMCGPKKKAIAYAKAVKLYLEIVKPIVTKLRAYRNLKIAWDGPDYFGSICSASIDAWKKVNEAYMLLFEKEDTESVLKVLKKALADYAKIMERWFQAARKYQEALDLIYYKASKSEILQTLHKAKELYESVGDIEMVEKICELEKKL